MKDVLFARALLLPHVPAIFDGGQRRQASGSCGVESGTEEQIRDAYRMDGGGVLVASTRSKLPSRRSRYARIANAANENRN